MTEPGSDEFQLPTQFRERLHQIVSAKDFDSVIASLAASKPTTFRVNTLRDTRANILDELKESGCFTIEPVTWVTDRQNLPIAFKTPFENRSRITQNPIIDEGKLYVQNLSSMLAPIVLDPQPEEKILDLAAAPGGKTIQIAQMMENHGVLSAVDAVRSRMFKLQANLQRCNVQITKTYLTDGRSVGRKTPERFDRVLLDAPCSSEARFRLSQPESWVNWSPRKIRESARKQFGLLKSAIHATRIGGRIVYCTCSFAPEENEQVVHKVLQKFGDAIEIRPIDLPIANWTEGLVKFGSKEFDPQVNRCRRIIPNELMDAFFVACIFKAKPSLT